MIKFKIFIFIVYGIIISFDLYSQESRFKDIYPYIESRNFNEAVPRLKEYLKADPDHPSANLQLALIFEERFRSYHPILQYLPAVKNAENAKTYFLKANLLVDEKEIKKNGKKYYTNFTKIDNNGKLEVNYSDVRAKVDSAYIQIDKFLRNIPGIYKNFTEAVIHYDEASRGFSEINGKYNNLKDLYLLFDHDVNDKLLKIHVDYDSSIIYLNEYLKASGLYAVLPYTQSFTIREIENYRLDGLQAQTDFLAQSISLWNYGAWIDKVLLMCNDDILKLKNQLVANEDRIIQNTGILSDPAQALKTQFKPKEVDRDLILKLRNYDHNSLVIPLLLYQDNKQSLLYRSLHEFEINQDSLKTESGSNLLSYYSQLFSICLGGDSLLQMINIFNNDFNRQKHDEFLKKYFPGNKGFDDYLTLEHKTSDEKKSEYAHKIKNLVLNDLNLFTDTLAKTVWKKQVIPVHTQNIDTLAMVPDQLYVNNIFMSPDSTIFFTGAVKSKKQKGIIHSFIGKMNWEHTVEWLNTWNAVQNDSLISNDLIGCLSIVPDGIAFVQNSLNIKARSLSNKLVITDLNGQVLSSFPLTIQGFPRRVIYNEMDGSYMIAAKGNNQDENIHGNETLEWVKISREGTEIWKGNMSFSGNINDLINTKNGYIVFGNFTAIRDFSGNLINTNPGSDETRSFAVSINEKGEISGIKILDSPDPYFILTIQKINDENINLLGFKGPFVENLSTMEINNGKIIHFIIDGNLNILYTGD